MLGIIGSPRCGGNTEIVVDEVLRGAKEAGAVTEKVLLNELDIGPCQACDNCLRTGKCIQQDDMPTLLQRMRDSEIWVLGTPVYWWGPTAQFKLFLDRWYQVTHERMSIFKGKRVILAIPLGDTDAAVARHTVGMLEDALSYVEADVFSTVLAPGVHKPGDVRQKPEVLSAARRAGQECVLSAPSKQM